MLEFFFSLCIAPFESVMRSVLMGAYAMADSWGASLILLSIAVNVALIPFYHLAETWQEAERAVQRAMAPKLTEIREVFAGRERYMYTRALYRLHGYSPVYALRASAGLLIQIPFFVAAYHLLNSEPALSGASWMFLADLSKPDALISFVGHQINLLPFVMTAANLVSAAVYTSRLTRRETIQLYGLAALFLVLLYPSSSALLIYWTCNNLFSIGKNLIYRRFMYHDAPEPSTTEQTNAPPRPFTGIAAYLDVFIVLLAGVLFVSVSPGVFPRQKPTVDISALSLGLIATALLFAILALLVRIISLKRGADLHDSGITRHYGIFPCVIAAISAACAWKLNFFVSMAPFFFAMHALCAGLFAAYALSRGPLLYLCRNVAIYAEARLSTEASGALFQAASLVMAVLVCWYTPVTLYASDSYFFYEPFTTLLGGLSFRGLAFLVVCGLIHHLSHIRIRPFLSVLWAWIAVS